MVTTGIIGIAGVLFGLFADRVLQRQGKVRCVMEPIEMSITAEKGDGVTLRCLPIPREVLKELPSDDRGRGWGDAGARYFLNVKFFNEKEMKTGLRDVVLIFDGNPPLVTRMLDRSTWRPNSVSKPMDELEVVNLPSREWVGLSLMGQILHQEVPKLAECDKAWLRGYYPSGKLFSQRVPFAR